MNINLVRAESSRLALARLIERRFDVAFLDLQLRDQTGLMLLADLRLLDPRMTVIVLTTNTSIDQAIEATRKGARLYLLKPLDLDLVAETLQQIVLDVYDHYN
jgi:ActR/RegA family two-component response regulator